MELSLIAFLVVFGLLTGMLSTVLGVGGGIFMVPVLVLVADLGQQEAQATSLLVIVPTAVVATAALRRNRVADLPLAAKIGALGVVGGVAGAAVALAAPGEVLRYSFALLLALVGVRLLVDARRLSREAADTAGGGA